MAVQVIFLIYSLLNNLLIPEFVPRKYADWWRRLSGHGMLGTREKGARVVNCSFIFLKQNIHSLVLCPTAHFLSPSWIKKKKKSSSVQSSSNTVLRARPTAQQAARNRMSLFPVTCRDLCSLQGQTSRFYLGSRYVLVYKHPHRCTYNQQVLYIWVYTVQKALFPASMHWKGSQGMDVQLTPLSRVSEPE